MSDLNRRKDEYVQHAMNEMDRLYWLLYEANDKRIINRVETIIGKLYDLQQINVKGEEK